MTERERGIINIGASHQTASVAARERFALSGERGRLLCLELAAHPDVLEVAALATCNRSELYLVAEDVERVTQVAVAAFARLADAAPEELDTMLAVRPHAAGIDHLMRTAGGIESVVPGEAQIQGQVRIAHQAAQEAGTCGPVLDRLFRSAVQVGKRARTETQIGDGRASVGSVAAELVAGRIGDLGGARIAVLGAGKMGGLAARSLADRGARRIDIANRSVERAAKVAAEVGFESVGVDIKELERELATCDAVVSSTNAPHAVITKAKLEKVIAARGGRPLVLVDLAVPRDIEPECGELPGVDVYDLDDLERVVSQTFEVRGDAVAAVEALAAEATEEFTRWLRAEDATPAIRDMRERAEAVRSAELKRFMARMVHLAPEDRRRIEQLTRSIVNRLLHAPTVRLREAAERAVAAGEPGAAEHE
ncbi:MAG: glutamyl-tRNA reductase [Thermoleophilia bacterium]|nr:glutamyl-tRNA reductase [Thermoleophilia bacterium]